MTEDGIKDVPECRICREKGGELIAPCKCAGSLRWVHRTCLEKWLSVRTTDKSTCEICGAELPGELGELARLRNEQMRRLKITAYMIYTLLVLLVLTIGFLGCMLMFLMLAGFVDIVSGTKIFVWSMILPAGPVMLSFFVVVKIIEYRIGAPFVIEKHR